MKKSFVIKLLASALAVASLATVANAKGFTKSQEYKDGQFTDVPATQWYASEVKSAYELGFMNGQSDTAFSPDGNVTVAEGITMASRVHANYNGKTIAEKTGGKWYDMYIAYAVENGLIKDGQFANYDRNIMRYEMAVMFAKAMPSDYFTAKNDIKDIPDVDAREDYYDELMMLYKAGVVLGSDDYGNFYATNPIKRSETAAIINRVALPENRKEGKLLEYGNRNPAVYLIEAETMTRTVRNRTFVQSGWTYDNVSDSIRENEDYSSNNLVDNSTTEGTYLRKDVYTVDTGKVTFEATYTVSGKGASIIFEDINGNKLFELYHDTGKLFAIGKEKVEIKDYVLPSAVLRAVVEMDLDNRTARIIHNSKVLGTFEMADKNKASDLSLVCFATGVEDKLSISVSNVFMYWNYNINDTFRMQAADEALVDWTTEGDVVVKEINNDIDRRTPRISGNGKAEKKFDALDNTFVFETYVRAPRGQKGSIILKNEGAEAFRFDIGDGTIKADGTFARKYTEGVWQQVRIDADTTKDTAVVKVNGKICATLPFKAEKVDSVEITSDGTSELWFDDIVGYRTYDYPDYCPTPVPVNDDEWSAGMSVCSLWRDGSHFGWDCISPYSEAEPVTGFYDEGIPESMDWEIKFMVEHGYDYQRFCWYYGDRLDYIKKPRNCDNALHDGYFNAKYSDMLDFSIVWENASKGTKTKFYEEIWPYWVDWYLTDERYLCIDNKPVITIFGYDAFKEIMGSTEEVKKATDFMREECIKLGYDGAILLVSNENGNKTYNEEVIKGGFEGKAAYHFGEAAYDIEYQKIRMNAEQEAGFTYFIPSAGIGFNDIGWTETRTPLASAEDFEKLLTWIKDEYLPMYKSREGVSSWILKSVFTNTWNEFGEGHYVYPTIGLNKFGYLDAHRHVFSSVAGKNDSKHFDVEPTLNQKARLGYLYQTNRIPMRKLYENQTVGDDYDSLERIISWNFETEEDCKKWQALAKTTTPTFDPKEKALVGATTEPDGHIKMLGIEENFFDASKAKYLHVQMRLDEGVADSVQLYFNYDIGNNYAGSRGFNFSTLGDGQYHDYYIPLSANNNWQGIIKNIRFDPLQQVGNYYIKKIEFLGERRVGGTVFNIDAKEIVFDADSVEFEGDEIYVAGNPSEGFYSLNGFYYEWNRWNGNLMIKTKGGFVFDFVVGSDKVLVNGKEVTLKKKVELYDGLVVLPVKFIYDTAGYTYEVKDGSVFVEVRQQGINDSIASRVENEFEFNVPGDLEKWTINCAFGGVNDGVAYFDSTHNGTRFDPQFVNHKLKIDTTMYKTVEIRIKPLYAEGATDKTVKSYFVTNVNTVMSEKMTALANLANLTPDAEGFYTVTLDYSKNENWKGIATTIRIDPGDSEGHFEIDYIRFKIDENYVEEKEAQEKQMESDELEKLKADEGAPFYVKNPDAEQNIEVLEYCYGKCTTKIVEDDLRPGNKAFLVSTDEKNSKVWCYVCIPTRFKPGVTYKVDFEYRLVGDNKGNAAEIIPFSCNFRYADFKADGSFSAMLDHATAPKTDVGTNKVSTSDGWIKCSVTHKVSESSNSRSNDFFCIFTDPVEKDGQIFNHSYMIDNIVVTVVE